jgi:membrane protein YdbS with pleckstrin-like domain
VGNRALKLMVILLCCINSAMWLFYTESMVMAMIWGAVALGFFFWIVDDMRRGVPR